MPTYAIGDIHGTATALQALLAIVPLRAEDRLVTLGDYVDRGPDSRQVIETLLHLRDRVQFIPLMGNHEIMMLESRDDPAMLLQWCGYGGDATLQSYAARSLEDIPPAHWEFIEGCGRYHETERHFFVHANAFADIALQDQPDYMLFWEHLGLVEPHESGRTMICGHTPQRNGRPLDLGPAICVDTYACGTGWLTCLDVDSRTYWQANQKGETRTGAL